MSGHDETIPKASQVSDTSAVFPGVSQAPLWTFAKKKHKNIFYEAPHPDAVLDWVYASAQCGPTSGK